MPSSVNSSSSRLCGWRPSRMWAAPTPDSSARTAASSFGRMPPLTSESRSRTSSAVASEIRVVASSGSARQPSTSVRKTSLNAPSDSATAAAAAGVDVVGVALDVGPDRCDHRDVILRDVQQRVHVDRLDLAHEADVGLAAGELLLDREQAAVVAA